MPDNDGPKTPENNESNSPKQEQDLGDLIEQIESLPTDEQAKLRPALGAIIKLERTFTKFHAGPLPSSDTLREYEEIYPGAAKMIFEMANRESTTKELLVKGTVINERWKILGSISGYLGVLVIAGLATFLESETIAITLGVSGVFALVVRTLRDLFLKISNEDRSNDSPAQ